MSTFSKHPVFFPALLIMSFYCLAANAQETHTLKLKKLHAPVEVLRDEWGMNHIYASNQYDLFFAQGYCAAKDRLFQFEIWRRQATGTVAEILGERELKRDIGTRLFKYRGNMDKELDHYHAAGREIINAYVDGVNACVEEALLHPDKLPLEFKLLGIKPGKWTPEVVISRHQGLLGNITEELNIGVAVAAIGDAKVKELLWFHPKDPDLKFDSAVRGELLNKNILELYRAYRKEVSFEASDLINKPGNSLSSATSANILNQQLSKPDEHGIEGSNNWVVSGTRTASGHSMLANDPHRGISVPSLRYMVHLVAPGWNVSGAGEPEIPGISIGHNEYGAWGLTIFETDGEDLYVYDLNPNDLNQYFYKGQWVSMKKVEENIVVKNAGTRHVTLHYTVHGPVTYIDSANHKAYAVKCAWLEPGGAPYLASLRIDQSKNWDAFRDACSYSNIPGENMVWADKTGNIGWQVVGIAPIRKNFSGLIPVPGDGRYEWAGYLPIKERPHIINPTKGFFATANQHVTPDDYTHWDAIGYTWSDPYRGDRINEVLAADQKMSIEKMESLQTDYLSLPAKTLVPMLDAINFDSVLIQQAKEKLKDWNCILDKNSVQAGIYAMWENKIMEEANNRFVPKQLKNTIALQLKKVIEWLRSPAPQFGTDAVNERNHFLAKTFESAVAELSMRFGNDMNKWQYGQAKYKHIEMIHPLSAFADEAEKGMLNVGPLPRGGNSHTVGSTGENDNQTSGASFRIITDTEDWDKTMMINTPGQSGDPSSPYYRNLFEKWATDKYFPAYYSKEKIKEVTKTRTILEPLK